MAEEYGPTSKEVWGEIWNGVSRFTKENISKTRRSLMEFTSLASYMGVAVLVSPYIVPTVVRSVRNPDPNIDIDINKYSLSENIGAGTGIIGGFIADVGQCVAYAYAVGQDHPEFLLFPAATNAASGMYELGRIGYNNVRQKLLDKNKLQGLEGALEQQESVKG